MGGAAVKIGAANFNIAFTGLTYHAPGSYATLPRDADVRAAAHCAEVHKDDPSGFTGCVATKTTEYEKDNSGACSCDRGAFCQSDCASTMPDSIAKYVDRSNRGKANGWYYTPGICWTMCPDGYVDAGVYCLATCAKLTELSDEQATYIGVAKEGPYKPETYRY